MGGGDLFVARKGEGAEKRIREREREFFILTWSFNNTEYK